MRQVCSKRYTPEFVRAFEMGDSRFLLIAPSDYFLSSDFSRLRHELWYDEQIEQEHVYGYSEEEQLEMYEGEYGEEVIL